MDRSWMYQRRTQRGDLNQDFIEGLETFIEFACSKPNFMDGTKIRCPCKRCRHISFEEAEMVRFHLCKFGFVPNYFEWNRHGEMSHNQTSMEFDANWSLNEQNESLESYQQMVYDAAGPNLIARNMREEPNVEDKKFFDMLDAADRQLWSGCEKLTQLSAVARLLNIKTEYRLPEQCFDAFCQLFKDGLPEDNNMVDSFYQTKKLIQGLGLPVEKIDCCRLGCMLYWGYDKELTQCKLCQQPRYKKSSRSSNKSLVSYKKMYYFPLAPRLKRLYASKTTAASMRWHNEDHGHDSGVMCHPSDSEAWKHFNATHPSFALESRNVRLGLCTDGFQRLFSLCNNDLMLLMAGERMIEAHVEPADDKVGPVVDDPGPEEEEVWEVPPLFGVAMSPSALERPLQMIDDGKPAVYLDEVPEPEPSPPPFRPQYFLEGPPHA
ncbi:PREDICTED: uncharacterized protein LOC109166774 [Ipomoea nil]|uniref:uncharacterized protein LOC109166774 n=1 Tax=Ipomoea nil TaxID=35883 RepID=UPI00090196AE|nr:PREDICTED: uncharacterized protein LOC109166774 [Ipomoea nil]